MAKVILDPRVTGAKISKNIYGHFSEHLGRCIYQGLYVGENSPIPNVKGMRTDVVRGAEEDRRAGAALARRLLCGRVSLGGRHRPQGNPQAHGEHQLGRRCGGQLLRHPRISWSCAARLAASPTSTRTWAAARCSEMAEWVEYLNSEGDSTVVNEALGQRPQGSLGRQSSGAWATRTGAAAATCARNTMRTNSAAIKPTAATMATASSTALPAARTWMITTGRP